MSDRHESSLQSEYFSKLYDVDSDPWQFESSPYEQAKYQATVVALDGRHYAAGFEVGCSIGVLTERLAGLVQDLLAIDINDRALDQARTRCRCLRHVRFSHMQMPQDWPSEQFDLIVLSEVVYYLDQGDLNRLVQRVRASLKPGGDVLLVHWTGGTDYPLSGDEATELFISGTADFTQVRRQEQEPQYRLDLLRRFQDS